MNVAVMTRVENGRVNFLGGGAWMDIEVVIVVSHNASQSSLRGDPHEP
jgi:hypothetical protein